MAVIRPQADVAYCIYALSRRLTRTHNWIVAIKVLVVIHRTLREGDPTFREELMKYSYRGHFLHMANFKDDSSSRAWDCSVWVRRYALYLEERLECLRTLNYDIETERLTTTYPGASKVHSRTRLLSAEELLEQLPALQLLLYRIVGCRPEGGACTNYLIQYALSLVLKESLKIYCAINDGIINLVDMYFEMPKLDAVKALRIYKRASKQAESVADFYDFCKHLELGRNFQFPTLRQPPSSFLATMEEYVKEGPQTGSVSQRQSDLGERDESQHGEENPKEAKGRLDFKEEKEEEQKDPEPLVESVSPQLISIDDLLGLGDTVPKPEEIEETNALALTITSNGNDPQFLDSRLSDLDGTGWELALVSAPSDNPSNATDSNLGGGFNKLLLDSLYEDTAAQKQIQMQNTVYGYGYGYGYGYVNGTSMQNASHQQQYPFAMSNSITPPTNLQMASLAQQQQMVQQPQFQQYHFLQKQSQNMNMMYYQNSSQYPQPQTLGMNPSNPFGDPLPGFLSCAMPQHGNVGTL